MMICRYTRLRNVVILKVFGQFLYSLEPERPSWVHEIFLIQNLLKKKFMAFIYTTKQDQNSSFIDYFTGH